MTALDGTTDANVLRMVRTDDIVVGVVRQTSSAETR
jgi:hypothetical protein